MTDLDQLLDERLRDYGDRWRAAAQADLDATATPVGRPRRRRRADVLLAAAAAVVAVALVGGAITVLHDRDAALPAPVATPIPTPVTTGPIIRDPEIYETFRAPSDFEFGYSDGYPTLFGLRWTEWSATRATATGRVQQRPCDPSCPSKPSTPVQVELSAPRTGEFAQDRPMFTHAVITTTGDESLWAGGPRTMTLDYQWQAWTITAQSPGELLTVHTDGGETLTRPKEIWFGMSPGAPRLYDLTWTSWGPDTAVGTGTALESDCEPSCAEAQTTSAPVRITLDRVRDGRFLRATVAATGSGRLLRGDFTSTWMTDPENNAARWDLSELQ